MLRMVCCPGGICCVSPFGLYFRVEDVCIGLFPLILDTTSVKTADFINVICCNHAKARHGYQLALVHQTAQSLSIPLHSLASLQFNIPINPGLSHSCKRRWTVRVEDLLAVALWYTMWQRKLETLCQNLFDIWSSDICRLLHLDNLENLLFVSEPKILVLAQLSHMDRPESRSMTSCHILIQSLNSISP